MEFTGSGSKIKKERLVETFLSKLNPLEAKYFIKNLVGEMRHGFSEGLMEEAIAKMFNVKPEDIRLAHMVTGDLGKVCETLKVHGVEGLKNLSLKLFHPLKPMLAEMVKDVTEAIEKHGGKTYFEFKFDGIRVQIHKKNSTVKIYSRRLKNMTEVFPEIRNLIETEVKADVILEGEVIAVADEEKPLPFQVLMRRYGRTKGIEEVVKNIPTKLFLFDLLYLNGEALINKPFFERRKKLEEIVPLRLLTPQLETSNVNEAEKFLEEAIKKGHEGLMAKQPNSVYTPGVRGGKWLKIKKVLDTLDLVIIAADYGYGYRHEWLSDYYLAVKNEETKSLDHPKPTLSFVDYIEKLNEDRFRIVGKTFKGLTNEEIKELTNKLKTLILEQHGRTVLVKPEVVVEVAFSEIQKSPLYSAGYALRFARITRIREDKSVDEIDDLNKIKKMYEEQLKKKTSKILEGL